MPYDFYNKTTYIINYKRLYLNLIKNNILFDNNKNSEYIKLWLHKLKIADEKVLETATTKFGIYKLWNVFQSNDIECYEFIFNIFDIQIKIHFNVGVIHSLMNKKALISTTKNQSVRNLIDPVKVRFTYETLGAGYIPTGKPIIKAENHWNSDFWIIDGNHRLTYAIRNGLNKIPVTTLKAKDIINNPQNCFATEFDKLCYIMINEFYYLKALQMKRGLSSSEVRKYSYLNLNYFPFSTTWFGYIGLDKPPCILPT